MKFLLVILFCVIIEYVTSEYSAALTRTRGLRNRPSKLKNYRRLLPHVNITSTPLDLFVVREAERRSNLDTIWNWDWWCQLQPKTGNGNSQIVRHYYDSQLDQCFTFSYSGSGGNENNFNSLVECERHCKGTSYMTLRDTAKISFCGLQPNVGMCLAMNYRYYYDVNSGNCKTFVYGGCGGNQNRFATVEECSRRCMGPNT